MNCNGTRSSALTMARPPSRKFAGQTNIQIFRLTGMPHIVASNDLPHSPQCPTSGPNKIHKKSSTVRHGPLLKLVVKIQTKED